ncbi:hypothetical protein [Streptosporangium longisporum]|uniref:hypothetical protein n=1 Tax=Streptosporangium longisporum TaxID=46187 RepID=UPI0039A59B0C
MSSDPRTNTTEVTARPNLPSQGTLARRGTRLSTRAIGTPMLQIACPARKPTALLPLMPSAGTKVACAASPSYSGAGLKRVWSIRPASSRP